MLHSKRVVIVGGTSGIGRALAKAILPQGVSVVVTSRSCEKLNQLQAEIGQPINSYILDVTDEAAISLVFQTIGEFDHLVNLPGEPVWYSCSQFTSTCNCSTEGSDCLHSIRFSNEDASF